jgi:peroxiredoxin
MPRGLAIGATAPDFALTGIDSQRWRLADARGPNGTLVMFICNHCPYVRAAIGRIVSDAQALLPHGVQAIAVMPNDTAAYPEDSLDNMKAFARQHGMPFPYVIDETQEVARAYGAVCTPDFFGFDRDLKLRYRGRLDAGGRQDVPGAKRELRDAMIAMARGEAAPDVQHPSMGCSIKWRA